MRNLLAVKMGSEKAILEILCGSLLKIQTITDFFFLKPPLLPFLKQGESNH